MIKEIVLRSSCRCSRSVWPSREIGLEVTDKGPRVDRQGGVRPGVRGTTAQACLCRKRTGPAGAHAPGRKVRSRRRRSSRHGSPPEQSWRLTRSHRTSPRPRQRRRFAEEEVRLVGTLDDGKVMADLLPRALAAGCLPCFGICPFSPAPRGLPPAFSAGGARKKTHLRLINGLNSLVEAAILPGAE